jgi:hypothetical protein
VNEQVAVFPEASVAVTFTVVVPTGNKVPEAGDEVTTVPVQLSEATGVVHVTIAPHTPASLLRVIFAGQVTVGGWLSITLTVKVQKPPPTVEVEVTVVVPTGKNVPDAGDAETVPQFPLEVGAA